MDNPKGRVLIHRRAVRLKSSKSKDVPRKFARHLQFVANELAANRSPPHWEKLHQRPPFHKVKLPPLRAMARNADGAVMVYLVRERDDFYSQMLRVRTTADISEFSELSSIRPRTKLAAPVVKAETPAPTKTPDPWAAFSDQELERVTGGAGHLVSSLRSAATADVALNQEVLSAIGESAALVLVDMAYRPDRHRAVFDDGRTPCLADSEDSDTEFVAAVEAGLASGDVVAIDDESVLARLLAGELEEWMVFLHPTQRDMVMARYNGPARIRGGPGTGKSVVALHRAIELARRAGPSEKVLLATFVKTLPQLWRTLLARIDPDAARKIEVRTVDSVVHGLLPEDVRTLKIANKEPSRRTGFAQRALDGNMPLIGAFGNDPQQLLEEFDHVLAGAVVPGAGGGEPRALSSPNDYARLELRFRKARTREEVVAVWESFERYRSSMARAGFTDFALRRSVALTRATPRYAGVVVDEAQDLSSIALRILWRLDASKDHSGFLIVADGQQSIYPGGFSLLSLGIETRGRSHVLTTNWRTTRLIQSAADAVLNGVVYDDLDSGRVSGRPRNEESLSLRMGTRPEAHSCPSRSDELRVVAELVADRLEAGRRPQDLAVLVPTKNAVGEVIATLRAHNVDAVDLETVGTSPSSAVFVSTFHRAKGFEFDEVVVAGIGETQWPPTYGGRAATDPRDRPRHQRTLFVAMTRARDHLMLTGVAPLAPEVRDLAGPQIDLVVHGAS